MGFPERKKNRNSEIPIQDGLVCVCSSLTRIVIATSVTFIGLASKNTDRSVILRRDSGVHSPTLTIACCFRRIKSNLN